MAKPDQAKATTPTDELIARFQLESERAIEALRGDMMRLHGELATRVATLSDEARQMTATMQSQTLQLENAVHHTRKGVEECNLALKEAGKQAREAADSAAVFAKLKDSQPDFAAQVRALEVRLAAVVDSNSHISERVTGLVKQLEEFEVVAEGFEETVGEVRGLDLAVKKLDSTVRTSRPI
jgi:chromosome segregation ATPase